jgi:hypothetical protein
MKRSAKDEFKLRLLDTLKGVEHLPPTVAPGSFAVRVTTDPPLAGGTAWSLEQHRRVVGSGKLQENGAIRLDSVNLDGREKVCLRIGSRIEMNVLPRDLVGMRIITVDKRPKDPVEMMRRWKRAKAGLPADWEESATPEEVNAEVRKALEGM